MTEYDTGPELLGAPRLNHSYDYLFELVWMVMIMTWKALPFKLNSYAEDSERHKHTSWMAMPKTANGITIQVEWLCQRQSTSSKLTLNGYTEDTQRHNYPSRMVKPKTVNGITIEVVWLCRSHSRHYHSSWMVMPKTVNVITIQDE